MSNEIYNQVQDIDRRTRNIEQKIFNGLSTTTERMNRWLDNEAPKLLTKDDHDRIEKAKEESVKKHNTELANRRDRQMKLWVSLIGAASIIGNTILAFLIGR